MDNFFLIAVIILIPFAIAGFSYAPWVPTRNSDIKRVMDMLKIKKNTVFYELGCGDGRTSFEVADKLGIEVIGVELNPFLYFLCLMKKSLLYRNKNIKFLNKNLFNISLKDANIIYTFGMPEKMLKLADKIKSDCKKGTQVISYTFPIEGLGKGVKNKPEETMLSVYIYEV